jgi:endoglucanase
LIRKTSVRVLAIAGVVLMAAGACHSEPSPQTAAAASATDSPTAPQPAAAAAAPAPGPTAVPEKECPPDFTVDDAEDNNNQVLVQGGRKGYWYTFVDKAGTSISPPAGTKFLMSPGGSRDSKYAARMIGKVSGNGDPLFAGMGFSFYGKVGSGSTKTVRLKVPDIDTDPSGKRCTECFNDFGADLTMDEHWKRYFVPFATMKQMEGWGSPTPPTVDKSKLYGLQWQVVAQGASYDIWIDDVQFTGCP